MKLISYYHLYLTDDHSWSFMFMDQMKELHDSGLFQKLDELNITAIGTEESINVLFGLLQSYSKYMTCQLRLNSLLKTNTDGQLKHLDTSPGFFTETSTLKMIWDRAQEEIDPYKILYFHSKGITAVERVLKNNEYDRFINYHYWRKFMDWSVIEQNAICIESLSDNDVAGANYTNWPCPHYSGNYWWANSKYLKTLPDPTNDIWWNNYRNEHPDLLKIISRVKDEMWIGSGKNVKMHSLFNHHSAPPASNLGQTIIHRQEYHKNPILS